jgi:hypothetical protein
MLLTGVKYVVMKFNKVLRTANFGPVVHAKPVLFLTKAQK